MKNKLIYALLSLVIALGLWFYVIAVVSPESEETYYDIPVALQNAEALNEKGLMIANQNKSTVTLRLRGNRSDLNKLKNSDIMLTVDLSKINRAGEQYVSLEPDFPGSFASNAFEILSQSMDRIMLDIVEWSSKEVDITPEFVGDVPADYIDYRESYELEDNKVTVSGPKSEIDKITAAKVVIDLTDKTSTISNVAYELQFVSETEEPDLSLVTKEFDQVKTTVKIQRCKELPLILNVTYGGGATEEKTILTFKELAEPFIKVSGSEEALAQIEQLEFDINVAEIASDTEIPYEIKLPIGVENIAGLETVTVAVSFRDLKTVELPISNIVVENVPAGMVVKDISTKVCKVLLRGTEWQIDHISAKDVEIRVDLSNAIEGTDLYPATVHITNTSFPSVGAVTTHTVAVELAAEDAA